MRVSFGSTGLVLSCVHPSQEPERAAPIAAGLGINQVIGFAADAPGALPPRRKLAALGSLIPTTGRDWTGLMLAVAALGMLGFRFWRLGDSPFIQDEPIFLMTAREQLRSGHWVSTSPISGTQGLRYGPSVFWFYGVVQTLFGPAPEASIAAMCIVLCLAHIALAAGLARIYGGGWLQFATLLAFLASSPFQFIWSRLAWDQTVNLCAAWAVFLLCSRGELRLRALLTLGLVLGYAISSHLMVIPLVACIGAVIAGEMRRSWRRLAVAAVALGSGILLVNLPYLQFLAREPVQLTSSQTFSASMIAQHLLQVVRVATSAGIDYFLDEDWSQFKRWLEVGQSLDWASNLVVVLLALSTAAGLVAGFQSNVLGRRRIALLASLCWAVYPVVYGSRSLKLHPHYEFPTYWITAAGVASFIVWLGKRRSLYGNLAASAVLVFAFVQFAFIIALSQFLHERGGTRGIHYSTTVAQQEELVRVACHQPQTTVVLQNTTRLFPVSLKYLSLVARDCEVKTLQICPPECRPRDRSVGRLLLRYTRLQGGAVTF